MVHRLRAEELYFRRFCRKSVGTSQHGQRRYRDNRARFPVQLPPPRVRRARIQRAVCRRGSMVRVRRSRGEGLAQKELRRPQRESRDTDHPPHKAYLALGGFRASVRQLLCQQGNVRLVFRLHGAHPLLQPGHLHPEIVFSPAHTLPPWGSGVHNIVSRLSDIPRLSHRGAAVQGKRQRGRPHGEGAEGAGQRLTGVQPVRHALISRVRPAGPGGAVSKPSPVPSGRTRYGARARGAAPA